MGCYMSKNHSLRSTSATNRFPYRAELSRLVSFGSLTRLMEMMNQYVFNETLQCRKDVRCNLELVEEYFKSNLQSLVFCARLEKCLKRGKDSQLRVLAALKQFDEEQETGSETYSNTLKELKCFRAAGNPFTEKLLLIIQSVYQQQMEMLQKLQQRKTKLDKKLKLVNAWRKVSNVIFLSGFAAVLVSSIMAAAIAAPPVAAALSAACLISIGSVGKWVSSFWKKYEKALKGQKVVINSMQVGTYVVIKDLDSIRVLVERLEIDIASMLNNAELATEEGALKFIIVDIRKRLGAFMENIVGLGSHADDCNRYIPRAMTAILQRIMESNQQVMDTSNEIGWSGHALLS